MEQKLSKITREEWNEWMGLPCTQELIYRLQLEEEARRTMLGAGQGIRYKDALTAGSNAIDMNSRADALMEFREGLNYDNVVREDRKEAKSGETESMEGSTEGEDFYAEHSWAPNTRKALRRKAAGRARNSDSGGDERE